MARLLIYAVPYGMGPISRGTALASALSGNHAVTLATFGPGLALSDLLPPDIRVVDCGSRSLTSWPRELVRDADVFVSVMDPRAPLAAKMVREDLSTVFFDSLLWWRRPRRLELEAIDHYLAQFFPGVPAEVACLRALGVSAATVAPPGQRATESPWQERDLVMLYVGGLHSPGLTQAAVKRYLTGIGHVARFLAGEFSQRLLLTAHPSAVAVLQGEIAGERGIAAACLARTEFLALLNRTKLLLATPGLEATYEAFAASVPVAFLPPTHATHITPILHFNRIGCRSLCPDHLLRDLARADEVGSGRGQSVRSWSLIDVDWPRYLRAVGQAGWLASLLEDGASRAAQVEIQRRFVPDGLADAVTRVDVAASGFSAGDSIPSSSGEMAPADVEQ